MAFNFHNAEHLQFSFARRSFVDSLPDMRLPYLDLTYCIEGTMEYLINGEYVILEAGDAILFPVGSVRYRGFTDIPNYYASFNIQIRKNRGTFLLTEHGNRLKTLFIIFQHGDTIKKMPDIHQQGHQGRCNQCGSTCQ